MFLFLAFLVFATALLGVGYYVWSVPENARQDSLQMRMRDLRANTRSRTKAPSDLIRTEHRGAFAFLSDLGAWVGVLRRLDLYLRQANLQYKAANVSALCIGLALLSFLFFGLFGMNLLLRTLFSLGLGATPVAYISHVRAARLKKFEDNLPDAIDLFTRTMRAGHNIHSGLETIAEETLDPVRMEFRKLMEELALGSQIEPALHNLGARVPLIDLKFFITSLILQRQTGANMVNVLENLALLVRERLNMAAKMKAHTAQQRFSAGLLCALPLVVGLGFWFLKPEYIRLLYTDPLGSRFLTYAICSEIVGILVIRKFANIKF